MNNEPRIDPILERLLEEAPTLRAPDRLRADIAAGTRRTRQRPVWLTILKEPPMRHRSQLVVGSPTLRLAAVMVATTALVLAIGGVVIAGASPSPSPVLLPSPVATPAPASVTGTILPVDGTCSMHGPSVVGGVTSSSYTCTDTWTASDPRLTGTASRSWNEDTRQTDEGEVSVGIEAVHLQNEGGDWACWSPYVQKGATPDHLVLDGTFTCQGGGGLEGLTAVLATNTDTGTDAVEFTGLIFSGELPPLPEPPAAQ